MLSTYLLCVFLLTVVATISAEKNEYSPEIPCTTVGGMCLMANDCPQGQRATDGLCPQQQRLGVECCYGLSVHETRCQERGGQCTSSHCPDSLVDSRATDCGDVEVCCILV